MESGSNAGGANFSRSTPIRTVVESLVSEQTPLEQAVPGGLIGVGTRLDPLLTKEDRLIGQVLGAVGSLPPVLDELVVRPSLMRRVAPSAQRDELQRRVSADHGRGRALRRGQRQGYPGRAHP